MAWNHLHIFSQLGALICTETHRASSPGLPQQRGTSVKTKLTKANVATLALPEGKADVIYFDREIPGFGIRFRRGAQGLIVSWVLQHKHGRETFGRYPAIGSQAAREWATRLHGKLV